MEIIRNLIDKLKLFGSYDISSRYIVTSYSPSSVNIDNLTKKHFEIERHTAGIQVPEWPQRDMMNSEEMS